MEILDLFFLLVGNAVLKVINKIFNVNINFGDGGKVITGIAFIVAVSCSVVGLIILTKKIK
jgi:hypothetical protein